MVHLGRAALYRCFNDKGTLIYVGVTEKLEVRMNEHQRRTPWAGEIARMEVEWFDERADAIMAEGAIIDAEAPRYNTNRSGVSEPQRPNPKAKYFNARAFLEANFGTPEGVVNIIARHYTSTPRFATVVKWFSRSSIPSEWATVLLWSLEQEVGHFDLRPYFEFEDGSPGFAEPDIFS